MRHLLINFHVQPSLFAHISASGVLLCIKMGSMNRFIADCSRYVFWFHIISKSGNAVLASQSEEVIIAGSGQVVDIPDWPYSALHSCC